MMARKNSAMKPGTARQLYNFHLHDRMRKQLLRAEPKDHPSHSARDDDRQKFYRSKSMRGQ